MNYGTQYFSGAYPLLAAEVVEALLTVTVADMVSPENFPGKLYHVSLPWAPHAQFWLV